jgi:hypothetical protein
MHSNISKAGVLGKRKRPSDAAPLEVLSPRVEAGASLPPAERLEAVVDYYFSKIHFWIPLIHEGRFRARLTDPEEQPKLVILLHAMVVISLKHLDGDAGADQIRFSRNIVMLNAMETLSVENLQALALLAFDHVSKGDYRRARG